ncbi:unnamed protein product [Rhodiola kirilowii]
MAGENGGSHGSVGCIDIISGLPDEIRERILGYLPICDAVRSSVLSRKWRYSWTRAPQLNLCLDEELETDMDFSSEEYRVWVGRILLSHVGPIHTFILHMTLRDRDEDLNTWLLFLSRNGIKDLRLLNEEFLDFFYVPQSIFQCLGLSFNLYSSLPFRGFPNLTKLVLFDVDIPGDMLEQVISCCLLEVLFIERCGFYTRWPNHCARKNAITAPNLRILRVVCSYYWYLKYTPNLRVASFSIDESAEIDFFQSNCFDVLRSMPKVEVLTFQCPLHKPSSSDVILKKLPELLVNLKTVTLYGRDAISVDEMSFMFCIMRSSPNLKTLDIHTDLVEETFSKDSLTAATAYVDAVDKEEIKTSVTTLSVTISRYYVNEEYIGAQTALMGSIISCCPTLEKLPCKTAATKSPQAVWSFFKQTKDHLFRR